jgi:hypothetical protein
MRHEIELRTPITIDGRDVKKLPYDFDKITADRFLAATNAAGAKVDKGRAYAFEMDYGLHLYLAYEAVVAENPDWDIRDLERVKGYDVIALQSLGRNFITGKLEELLEGGSQEESFESYSETTQENFQLPSSTSEGETL